MVRIQVRNAKTYKTGFPPPHFKEVEGSNVQRCSALQRGSKVLGSIFKTHEAYPLFEINIVNNFAQVSEQNHLKNGKLQPFRFKKSKTCICSGKCEIKGREDSK